ncbi:hypothetical protein [Sporosarcina obsidiansis]|uniref:hypothetical protein n=1 Tax=Sporosarcina obsidiansis TaxID=2660748 RepID=UPI001E412126|nr:hypothetical protein [Sporosarcina obsidiansis]
MKVSYKLFIFLIMILLVTACSPKADSEIKLPEDIPDFVKESDFKAIDWDKKAVPLGDNIIGNENKSGVIGADMPSLND